MTHSALMEQDVLDEGPGKKTGKPGKGGAQGRTISLIIIQKDLGAALLFFTIFLAMLYVLTGRTSYVVVGLLIFALGIGLLIAGNTKSEEMVLLGVTMSAHIVKGSGIIAMIFSVITLLVAFGSSLPASPCHIPRSLSRAGPSSDATRMFAGVMLP